MKRHGHATGRLSPTYISWRQMWQRCTNPRVDAYPWYGGRGIQVCEEWREFSVFLLDMGPRPEGTTLDRKNPSGAYTKDNCRWATKDVQAHNTRGVKLSPAAVVEIREWAAADMPKAILATAHGVSRRQISNVVRGVQWR